MFIPRKDDSHEPAEISGGWKDSVFGGLIAAALMAAFVFGAGCFEASTEQLRDLQRLSEASCSGPALLAQRLEQGPLTGWDASALQTRLQELANEQERANIRGELLRTRATCA